MHERSPTSHSVAGITLRFRLQRTAGLLRRAARRVVSGHWRRAGAGLPAMEPPEIALPALPPRVLVVDTHVPRPELDSGSVRMVALLRILADMGLPAAFVSDDFDVTPPPAPAFAIGARGVGDVLDWIQRHHAELRAVILSRHTVASHWLPLIRAVLPGVPVVFDTVDLHHLREQREAEQAGSPIRRMLAARTREAEFAAVHAADATWVVSDAEQALLRRIAPAARVDVVSNIVDPLPGIPAFDARRDFVFLGNFAHAPNVDAVEWLAALWPPLRERCGDARLRIVGAGLPQSLRQRMQVLGGVDVTGHVADLDAVLATSRVMLAPLRYGAGVKGKINAAFAAGLPVVATSCAIEGMQIGDERVACVADQADAFVDAAARLYHEPGLWARIGEAASRCLVRHFSTAAAREAIERSFASLGVEVPAS